MSKPDMRAIVDLHIDFVVQNVSTKTMQCHYTDGWGPSSSDPKGQEGLQDCLLDRYQLCAESGSVAKATADQNWFDFTACVFRNQKETGTINDDMQKFDATVQYCSMVSGYDYTALKACAESDHGAELLLHSHNIEKALNPFVDKTGHHHPDWVLINGRDYGKNSTADWLQIVCDAYTGSPKPASCTTAVMV